MSSVSRTRRAGDAAISQAILDFHRDLIVSSARERTQTEQRMARMTALSRQSRGCARRRR